MLRKGKIEEMKWRIVKKIKDDPGMNTESNKEKVQATKWCLKTQFKKAY